MLLEIIITTKSRQSKAQIENILKNVLFYRLLVTDDLTDICQLDEQLG
jgi:hypothetical protein